VTEFRLFTQIQDRVTARAHQAPHLVVAGVAADLEVAKWPEDRRAVFYDLVTRDLAERRCAAEAPPESVPGPPHPGPGETQYLSTEAAKATVASGTVQSEPATAKAAGGAEAAEAGGAWAAYRRTLLDASRQLGVRRLRPPFLLREVLDCTAIQAAQALRLSPPVVEHLVAQARQRLPQLPPPPGPRPSPEGVPIFGPVAGTSPKHS
jgi:DNA-directed RNA polymerase specialized sigma24 family protein